MMINNLNENLNVLDSSSQGSLSSELSLMTIDIDKNKFDVQRIKHNRNKPRISYGQYLGSLAFDIIWDDNSETREPLQNLIDIETESINLFIIDFIEDYKKTAIKYPKNNRCCIMCYDKVFNGAFMCSKHRLMYSFLCH